MLGRIFRVGRTPVTLLVLLGILVWAAWWGYQNVIRPVPAAPAKPCVEQTVAGGKLKSSQVVVGVYNGGDRRGLAGDVGRSLRERGFKVTRTTNTQQQVTKTVIVGADAKSPEVLFVKTFFKEAVARGDDRPDHSVEVLVGNKYAGFNKKAPTTYEVQSTTVCLPSQDPSASAAGS